MSKPVPQQKGMMTKLMDKFKSMDLYGQEFSLNYRGGETFKTYHGAIFSILVVIFVVNHTAVNLVRLINRKQPDVFAH